MALLEVRRITKYFGGLAALKEVEFEVHKGELLGIIGPNGAGKTTLYNIVTGFYKPTSGSIIFRGENIVGQRMDKITGKGIVRTWQTTVLFENMSALENVIAGHHLSRKAGFWKSVFFPSRHEEKEIAKRSIDILEFLGLVSVRNQLARSLPHGYKRALGVAIALAARPDILLLDEPVTGMNPEETATMMKILERIRDRGVTLGIIEHDVRAVMSTCDRIVVLNFGQKIAEGVPQEIQRNKDVIQAYLGAEKRK